jgi:hypothetical protein
MIAELRSWFAPPINGNWLPAGGEPPAGNVLKQQRKIKYMLYTLAVVLIILWLLGLVTSYTMGGLIHLLLVVALVMVLFNFFTGRRAA